MTRQRPEQAIWPGGHGNVPARTPGRAPAVVPTQPARSVPSTPRATAPAAVRARASRVRGVVALLAALLAGAALGAGFAGWPASPSTQGPTNPRPTERAEGLFAQRQASVNRSQTQTEQLAEFAGPWLTRIGDCASDTVSGGPQRGEGEQARTRCTAGIVTVYWISYRSIADRDTARARYATQAAQSQDLAPGMRQPTETTDRQRSQMHVEYAYRVPAGAHAGQIVAALWWSDPAQPVAGVLTAYWEDGLGSSWEPLRDLWRHHS